MKTETNFTEAADTFKDNVTKGMKWMQDATEKLVETTKQQLRTTTDMFNKAFSTSKIDGTYDFGNSFGDSSKAMSELFQKNIESATNLLKVVLKPVTELPKFSDKEALSKEMKKQFEDLNKKVSDLTVLNQANLDTIIKQFETATKSFTPLTEKFKKELETAVVSSKETMQSIIDSYSDFAAPSIEANKEAFEKLNDQIKTSVNANIKFWSDLMNPTTPPTAKTSEAKVDSGLLKISTGADNKKYANDRNASKAMK